VISAIGGCRIGTDVIGAIGGGSVWADFLGTVFRNRLALVHI
jgi:hypothetical protein